MCGRGGIHGNCRNKREREIYAFEYDGAGLDVPTSGSVVVRGKELSKMNDEQLTVFRRRNIGFIFQNYNLIPILNAYENIIMPVELDGNRVNARYVEEVAGLLSLKDRLEYMPGQSLGRAAAESGDCARPGIKTGHCTGR